MKYGFCQFMIAIAYGINDKLFKSDIFLFNCTLLLRQNLIDFTQTNKINKLNKPSSYELCTVSRCSARAGFSEDCSAAINCRKCLSSPCNIFSIIKDICSEGVSFCPISVLSLSDKTCWSHKNEII